MLKGSCLCGAIQYELDAPLGQIGICHCQRCRKASGTAYGVNATVEEAGFRLVEGADSLTHFAGPTGVTRSFCRHCGSPLYSRRDSMRDALRLRLGCLDTPIAERPLFHFFTGSKAEWDEIHDDLPQHPERPQDPQALAPGRRTTQSQAPRRQTSQAAKAPQRAARKTTRGNQKPATKPPR